MGNRTSEEFLMLKRIGIWLFIILIIAICVCVVVMSGCSSQPYLSENYPELIIPPDPKPPINNLTRKSTPDQVVKAWVATAILYKDWNVTVRKQIIDSSP